MIFASFCGRSLTGRPGREWPRAVLWRDGSCGFSTEGREVREGGRQDPFVIFASFRGRSLTGRPGREWPRAVRWRDGSCGFSTEGREVREVGSEDPFVVFASFCGRSLTGRPGREWPRAVRWRDGSCGFSTEGREVREVGRQDPFVIFASFCGNSLAGRPGREWRGGSPGRRPCAGSWRRPPAGLRERLSRPSEPPCCRVACHGAASLRSWAPGSVVMTLRAIRSRAVRRDRDRLRPATGR